ncbi:MAG: DHA2 family efflux MFS transporter permease subunit [Simkaniaceae bacterium]|nr:DHA2 family efflux MFS transporter permease subunit [Simkaniaceae bacterium]
MAAPMNQAVSDPMLGTKRVVFNLFISLLTFMYVLDYSIANVAIPYIAGSLAVSTDQGTYVITSFAIGNAICLPLTGWLVKRFGERTVIVISTASFTLFSWFCGASVSIEMIVIGRFIQGFCAGPIVPLSQGLLAKYNPPDRLPVALAIWVMIVVVGPIAGPILGGWICVDYVWPWIFYINVPFGILTTFVLYILLIDREDIKKKVPTDYLGLVLLTLAVSSMQIVLDKGQQWDWFNSHVIIALTIISVISYTYLFIWLLVVKFPLLDLHCFKFRSFRLASIQMFFGYGIYFGMVVLVPLWLQQFMGYNALWAGLAVAPFGLAPLMFSALMPKVVAKFGTMIPLAFCMLIFALVSYWTAHFDTNVDYYHIALTRFWTGVGFVFFVVPVNALVIQDLPSDLMHNGLGIFHFLRSVSGAIGTSVFTTIWQRRTIFHHARLSEMMSAFNENLRDGMKTLMQAGFEGDAARLWINRATDQQAAMLSFNDVFLVIAILSAILCLLLLYAKYRITREKAGQVEKKGDPVPSK